MNKQLGQLVKMANQIALNFGELRDPQGASRKTAEHLHKFWTRDMRDQLAAYVNGGGDEVSPVVVSALGGRAQAGEVQP